MDDSNEWEPVALAVLEKIDDVIDRRLRAFRDSLDVWLANLLAGPIPANWRDELATFVDRTAAQGLAMSSDSIDKIAAIIESRARDLGEPSAQRSARRLRSRIVDGAFVQSVIPNVSGLPVTSRPAGARSTHVTHISMGVYSAATQSIIGILGPKWTRVSPQAMSRVRDAGALVDQHTGAPLGSEANALGVEAFVGLHRKDGGMDTAHFHFVWTGSESPHWEFVELKRGKAPEQQAAALAAREKIRHDDVMRVRGGINRAQGGMFAVIGGINGVVEGAPLLGILEAAGGAEQVALAGADLATGKEHRAWSARGIQAVLEAAGIDTETAQFLADNGGLLIALGRAAVDAAGTAHAVIETSTGYRIRLEFDPATLSANGLGGAKIKMEKLARAGGKGTARSNGASGKGTKARRNSRPTPRESELDVEAEKEEQGFHAQRSYKKGKEVPRGTKGSSRPDADNTRVSVEVKNYDITTSSGRGALVQRVVEQAKQRVMNLSKGMRQEIHIDIRGQKASRETLRKIISDIVDKSNGIITSSDIRIRHD